MVKISNAQLQEGTAAPMALNIKVSKKVIVMGNAVPVKEGLIQLWNRPAHKLCQNEK